MSPPELPICCSLARAVWPCTFLRHRSTWRFKCSFLFDAYVQRWQLKPLCAECVRTWVFRCEFCAAAYPQPGCAHLYGRSWVCVRRWRVRWLCLVVVYSHPGWPQLCQICRPSPGPPPPTPSPLIDRARPSSRAAPRKCPADRRGAPSEAQSTASGLHAPEVSGSCCPAVAV